LGVGGGWSEREGERDGRLGCVLVEFAKAEEKRKEKKRRKFDEFGRISIEF
jgi:hypothetical protein